MFCIHYSKQEYLLPQEFNELTEDQLINISLLKSAEEQEDVARLKALQILLGFTKLRFFLLHEDLKTRMLEYSEWVFKENTLTDQLIPSYHGFYGPKKELMNYTLGEFHLSEVYYHDLVVDKDEEAGDKLIAVLYRLPKDDYNTELDSEGDIRILFNSNEIDYYSRIIAKWPAGVKQAILGYYDGCRQHLIGLYDRVFEGGSNTGDDNQAGMFDVIRGLSGPKYGDIDKVEKVNIHTALNELEKQIIEAEELERLHNTNA